MKKIYIILVLLTLSVTALAQSGKSLYNKYSDRPGVEAVYISPAMFRMIGKIPDVEFKDGEIDFTPIIKSMSGFYVLEASDPKVAADLYAEVKKFIDKGDYELLIETKENGEVTQIYSYGDEKTVSSLVMIQQEQGETMYVSIDGKMDREELENLLAQAAAE